MSEREQLLLHQVYGDGNPRATLIDADELAARRAAHRHHFAALYAAWMHRSLDEEVTPSTLRRWWPGTAADDQEGGTP